MSLVAFAAGGFAADPLVVGGVGAVGFVAAVVFVFLAAVVAGPLVLLSVRDARVPTEEERAILDDLLDASGYDPDRVRVVDTVGDRSVQVSIRGLPTRRYLVVTDYVIRELDADVASALLAAEAARARLWYAEYRGVAAAVALGLATAVFAALIPFSDGFFAVAVSAFALFWLGRRLQFRADAAAADRVGSEALAGAFERVADLRGVEPDDGGWRTLFEIQPPLGQRIERLRGRSN
ncbi:peptidase [Haloferacaceae archaeon DSL9]